jgi:hypothetical protein
MGIYNEYRDYKIEYKIIKSTVNEAWKYEKEILLFSDYDGVIVLRFG